MADVFVSYSSSDKKSVAIIDEALRRSGYTTWWDRNLRSGRNFDQQIEEQLVSAGLVLAVWSRNSIVSKWVRAESAYAERAGKLLSIRLDDCDLPPPFNLIQSPRISVSDIQSDAPSWRELLNTVTASGHSPQQSRDQSGVASLIDSRMLVDRPNATNKYIDAFVIYHPNDDEHAFALEARLRARYLRRGTDREAETIRQERKIVLMDHLSVRRSSGLLGTFFRGDVSACRRALVICTPGAASNQWVDHEIDAFAQVCGSENIIALVFEGDPLTGGNRECVPLRLRFQVDVNGQVTNVPQRPFMIDFRRKNAGETQLLRSILVPEGPKHRSIFGGW